MLNCSAQLTSSRVFHLGIEEGLSNNNVTTIYKDQAGVMWFGTDDGLNRYDSYRFRVYKNHPSNQSSLSDNRITDISQDADGYLWVSTKSGAARMSKDGNTFEHMKIQTSIDNRSQVKIITSVVSGFTKTKNSDFFVASTEFGLLKINKEVLAQSIPLFSNGKKIANYNVDAITSDNTGSIWISVRDHGLCFYDKKKGLVLSVEKQIGQINSMTFDAMGDLWLASNRGLIKYNLSNKSIEIKDGNSRLSEQTITHVYSGGDELYASTDGGGITVFNVITGNIRNITERGLSNAILSESVREVFIDEYARTWIATARGGINIVDPYRNQFPYIRKGDESSSNDPANYVLAMAEGKNNDLWIGTEGRGLMKWQRNGHFETYNVSNKNGSTSHSDIITSILVDDSRFVWVGSWVNGIKKLNVDDRRTEQIPFLMNDQKYEAVKVWRIFKTSKGQIIASTLGDKGLFKYEQNRNAMIPFSPNIRDVLSIYEDSSNTLWLGCWVSVIAVNTVNGTTTECFTGKPVRTVHENGPSQLWLGTEGKGLMLYDKQTNKILETYTDENGLPSNSILNIVEDSQSNLWLSTPNGLTKFSPKDRTFKNYRSSDGLQSNQFSYNAALNLRSGEIAFGGIRGFNLFDPKKIDLYRGKSTPMIIDLRINNKSYYEYRNKPQEKALDDLGEVEIDYDDASIAFTMTALEYSFPENVQYAYFLEGWDKDWNYVKGERNALYSRLTEGTYILHIKSTNADGSWTRGSNPLIIKISPPWYRSIWAYLFYISCGFILIRLYISYKNKQQKLFYEVEVSKLEAENEKLLTEKKLTFFTHIAHEFRNPLTLIVDPLQTILNKEDEHIDKQELTIIYNNSKRLNNLVDKLLMFRKVESGFYDLRPEKFNLITIIEEIFHCFKQQASKRNIQYELDIIIPSVEVFADREKFEICLFNLVSNALKFTPDKGTVKILVSIEDAEILINVIDSGPGINDQASNRIFEMFQRDYETPARSKEGFGIGLYLVKKFAELNRGTVVHKNMVPSGSCFRLSMPIRSIPPLENTEPIAPSISKSENEIEATYTAATYVEPIKTMHEQESNEISAIVNEKREVENIIRDKEYMIVVEDDVEIRNYLVKLLSSEYKVKSVASAEEALELINIQMPDIVLTDVVMGGISGIDLCIKLKSDPLFSHIPIILLTASTAEEVKLKGIESGADDYITKPFNTPILLARVKNLVQSRSRLQNYFYSEITLQKSDHKISSEYKEFLDKAITIVEKNFLNGQFTVRTMSDDLGISHSNLYKRIRTISGKSVNEFIRYVRLRKAAELLINTDNQINEIAYMIGFSDVKYFRTQFVKLFGITPTEYRRKYITLNSTSKWKN
ncbi:two-component regulator propeller domain-containing protein [Sphingobacterium oryzagri]|uniref:histidine kinase n=1 Tax=Sphingobacterium oryzagri TaxID=3025669 RepID=A0ABY7WFK4_9SPHI|nr:two-component regulator propeller domain-containing protein [Sphingobacterium sp. KACC 22765]WDF67060.1 two-component regulator propeller domain-containing protein [Sphingobacterium sp. KACC 22765]